MGNFWKRKIKNTKQIADKVGVEEQKIKELVNGEREITGDAMDKVLNAINEEKNKTTLEKQVEDENVLNWARQTDINKLIHDFGFGSQKECAKKIGIAQSTLCGIAKGRFYNNSTTLQKVYNFFNNEFNKETKATKGIDEKFQKIEDDEIKRFFEQTTPKDLKEKLGLTSTQALADISGCSRTTIEMILGGFYKEVTPTMKKVYNKLQQALKNTKKSSDTEESKETPQISTNKEVNTNTLGDTETSENKAKNVEKQDVEEKHNEEVKKETQMLGDDSKTNVEETKNEENKTIKKKTRKQLKQEIKSLKNQIQLQVALFDHAQNSHFKALEKLQKENIKLKKQIKRYEILIDRLK